jgi:outer membrane receptor protein involved in Fe transport
MEKETDDWGFIGSYVYAKNDGNTEGLFKSDLGQDDPGLTEDFDLVALSLGADGPLPTEVEHQLKVAGYYVFNDQLRVGATARIRSPRQFGCMGTLPEGIWGDSGDAYSYDAVTDTYSGTLSGLRQEYEARYDYDYWFCNDESGARGTKMESDWIANVDLSMTYAPNSDALPGALSFRVDVFNLLNDDGATDMFELGETLGGPQSNYGTPSAYNPPRKVRLSVNWKF